MEARLIKNSQKEKFMPELAGPEDPMVLSWLPLQINGAQEEIQSTIIYSFFSYLYFELL